VAESGSLRLKGNGVARECGGFSLRVLAARCQNPSVSLRQMEHEGGRYTHGRQ
jgi:hypothetical protein